MWWVWRMPLWMEASSLSLIILPPSPCHPTGISTDDPSKSNRQLWPAQPVNQGCLEDTNVEFCSQQGETLTSNTALYHLRTPCWVPALREQACLVFVFPVTVALVPCFGLESVSLLPLWSFLRLVYFLTFFYLLLWVFIYVALTAIHIGNSYLFLVNS